MKEFIIFGTEFDNDDDNETISCRRPLSIAEQTVRDEQGRRRFHGAFTGGFSAGYFNTVGSKQGWEPSQFRSTREERWKKMELRPEDFMDEEDLGEFGIASRKLRTTAGAGGVKEKHRLAWEHQGSSLENAIKSRIEAIIHPIRDSMGIRLLKKMGWREGQEIGLKLSRGESKKGIKDDSLLENQNRPSEDVLLHYLKSRNGVHGLGYEGLKFSSILCQDRRLESALKLKAKSKGIRGQAFGVGVFEEDEDDTNIYTEFDWSKYDFSLDNENQPTTSRNDSHDTSFVMDNRRQKARIFFAPPRIPPTFRPIHNPILPDISSMPNTLQKIGETMTHAQRARFLGEVDKNLMLELVHDEDRKRLSLSNKAEQQIKDVFEDEPMKQARFKLFLNYLKRGLNFPQPPEMTSLEWERELADFYHVLPPHLRSLLPEVKSRQLPLASSKLAAPIAQVLKAKFVTSSGAESKRLHESKNQDQIIAVRSKMFGELTRRVYDWYPAKNLSKKFNIPDPYPSSIIVGAPDLQKSEKAETLLNLGSTSQELEYKANQVKINFTIDEPGKSLARNKVEDETTDRNHAECQPKAERPSDDFLRAVFGTDDSSESDSEDIFDIPPPSKEAENTFLEKNPKPEMAMQKMINVMDIDISDEEFGPVPPPLDFCSRMPFMKNEERKKRHRKEKIKNDGKEDKRSKARKSVSRKRSRSRRSIGKDKRSRTRKSRS